jgi:pimeloyl-ACP methyl ester carboxylesterase
MTAFLAVVLLAVAIVAGLFIFTLRTARRVEKEFPPIGQFVDVPGARLHVVVKGQGAAVLLVHGLGGQLRHFTYGIVDLLAAKYRVVAVDRPGSGYSERASGAAANLSAQADALAALIDVLELKRPVVVGHSLGGAVALALAQRHPERVAGLALISPPTQLVDVPPVFKFLVIPNAWLRTLMAWTLAVPFGIIKGEQVVREVFGPEEAPQDYATRGGGLLSLRPSHFVATSADIVAASGDMPQLMQHYGSMRLPVSVLFGRNDAILDPNVHGAGLVAKLPGAKLTLTDGGHMLPITSPERTAEFISEAVARGLEETKANTVRPH